MTTPTTACSRYVSSIFDVNHVGDHRPGKPCNPRCRCGECGVLRQDHHAAPRRATTRKGDTR